MKPEIVLIEIRRTDDGFSVIESVKTEVERKTGNDITTETLTDQRTSVFVTWEDVLIYLSDEEVEPMEEDDAPVEEVEGVKEE